MKTALVFFALAAFGYGSPTPRKLFHEHFDDFMAIIIEEVGDEVQHITEHYMEFDDFLVSLDYLQTQNFKDLVNEMEHLPEFIAVVDFLENDNIDIHYFLDLFHETLDGVGDRKKRSQRHTISGTDFNSYIRDIIDLFPKDKLAALYDEKMEGDEEFKTAMENLYSDEWHATFNALVESEIFQKEVDTLAEKGIDFHLVIAEILAVFGQ
ncbi:hypothetical protein EVAR_38570_1 [Eumeta japonica]|uniref:Single domain major allergen protein n=1 Tax=Eumeta variegata TaxID=151549 RepID=A0A4C1WS66_EUMVA|nr:hypothetical protein EVAR_38570_1 [Eumeta japonica]